MVCGPEGKVGAGGHRTGFSEGKKERTGGKQIAESRIKRGRCTAAKRAKHRVAGGQLNNGRPEWER